METRLVFFISDRTGITAEALGTTLLSQFDGHEFKTITLPFVNSVDKAYAAADYISHTTSGSSLRPIIFSTTVQPEVRAELQKADALFLDIFESFIGLIESELGSPSQHAIGRIHGSSNTKGYRARIDAMNYTLQHDDGGTTSGYEKADIILVAVSRCGKTPTCVYLAMQYSLNAANYPLTDDDIETGQLPAVLSEHRDKLYALTTTPEHLTQVRNERRPGSRYASIQQVTWELKQAEKIYTRRNIPFVSTHDKSIEEISSIIIQEKKIQRRRF